MRTSARAFRHHGPALRGAVSVQLLDHVWSYDSGGDARVLETYISCMRKKIDSDGGPLHTVRGVGRPPDSENAAAQ